MPIPGNLTTITVTGEFLDSNGNPLLGSVSFAPPVDIYDAAGTAIIGRVPYVATLNPSTGAFSITLPCTDNAAMNPTNWGYTVTINLTALPSGAYQYTNVGIPHTAGNGVTVDLTQILPPGIPTTITPNTYGVLASANLWAGLQTFQQASNGPFLQANVSGDNNYRFSIDTSGKIQWGPGNAALDTDLYRSGVGTLKTDGAFVVGGALSFGSLGTAPGISDWLNVRSAAYGADPTGVADSTTAINAALTAAGNAGGGTVYIPAGTYKISAPLVIYSNTLLLCSPNAVINLVSGSQCNMLRNVSITAQRTITDGAITINTNLLNSPSQANFTTADVGRSVTVPGALDGTKPLTFTITAWNSSTQVTVNVNAGATVSGASCSIYNRDSNVEIWGGTWNRGNNGWSSATSSPGLYTMRLEHADNWSVHDLTLSTANKGYELAVGDVTNGRIRNITGNTANTIVNTDLINIHGPAQWIEIDGVFGQCGDDFVSIHSLDGDGNLQNVVGNISNLTITNLYPNNNGQSGFKIHAGSTTTVTDITCRGVHGSSLVNAVALKDYATPTSGSIIDRILIQDVDCTTSGANGLVAIYCNNSSGTITLRDLVWNYGNSFPAIVNVQAGTTLGTLLIDGVTVEAGSNVRTVMVNSVSGSPSTVGSIVLSNLIEQPGATVVTGVQVDGTFATVKHITVRAAECNKDTNAQQALLFNKGNVDSALIDGVYLTNGGIVVGTSSTAAAMQVTLNAVTLEGAYQLAQIQSTVDMIVNGLDVLSVNQGALIKLTGAGAAVSVRGRGMLNPNNVACFSRDGTQTPRIVHRDMRVDVAQIATNLGDECYNTNSASGPAGPLLCDGTSWYPAIPLTFNGGIVSGQYSFPWGGLPASSTTFTSGEFRCYPVYIGPGAALERINVEVTVVGDASSTARPGIYKDNGSWVPGALVLDAGTVATTSTGVLEITLGSPLTLTPGWYWVGAVTNFPTTAPTVKTLTAVPVQFPLGTTIPAANTQVAGLKMTGVTGALPSTFTNNGVAGSCPRIGFKGH